MNKDKFGLPRRLDKNLALRWATTADTDELAEFNIKIHSDDPEQPELWLGAWTRDLMSGSHPTVGPQDFTVVVDDAAGGKIVSSLNLISQTWSYEDQPFGLGRPELVGTDPDYRQRSLVRAQMEVIHALSASRGQMVQAITGIPWYYRLFGYEMALDLGGSRLYRRDRLEALTTPEQEVLEVREATLSDLAFLQALYTVHCEHSMICRLRDEAQWLYDLEGTAEDSPYHRNFRIVVKTTSDDKNGKPIGYFEFFQWPGGVALREVAALPGHSLYRVATRAVRYLKPLTEQNLEKGKTHRPLYFQLGPGHPLYKALGHALVEYRAPYAWYMRVADLPGFIQQVSPVLERRLANSVMAGHTGSLRLNFFTQWLKLDFTEGQFQEIGTFQPERLEAGDVAFPGQTFLQLLFGFRSLDELHHAFPDCVIRSDEAAALLDILFPRTPSQPVPLG